MLTLGLLVCHLRKYFSAAETSLANPIRSGKDRTKYMMFAKYPHRSMSAAFFANLYPKSVGSSILNMSIRLEMIPTNSTMYATVLMALPHGVLFFRFFSTLIWQHH